MDEIFGEELILTRIDFDKNNKPRLKFSNLDNGENIDWRPVLGQNITLEIDTSERFCCGWHDLKTGADFGCPEKNLIDKKYEKCQACQKRTGFDPAFYNLSQGEISSQQLARNSQPHLVYLAYFSDEIIKVGITFVGRGIARLLEQGARAGLILGEFKSANIARNYEEKIAKMPQFVENVKANAKLKALNLDFEKNKVEKKLIEAKKQIEKTLNAKFDEREVEFFDQFYFEGDGCSDNEIIEIAECPQNSGEKIVFSGKLLAQVGYFWLAEQQGEILAIPLRKFAGYRVKIKPELTLLELPERQVSLFGF